MWLFLYGNMYITNAGNCWIFLVLAIATHLALRLNYSMCTESLSYNLHFSSKRNWCICPFKCHLNSLMLMVEKKNPYLPLYSSQIPRLPLSVVLVDHILYSDSKCLRHLCKRKLHNRGRLHTLGHILPSSRCSWAICNCLSLDRFLQCSTSLKNNWMLL